MRLGILYVCQAVMSAGMSLSFPFFALYLHRERGLSIGMVGMYLSFIWLTSAFSQGIGGELSDLFGRRRIMLLSMWTRAASILGLAAAMHFGWPFRTLLLFHLGSNFCANLFDPAAKGWIADNCGPNERAKAFNLIRIALNLGWAAGPAIGGWLAYKSYTGLFAASAVVCAGCALLVTLGIHDRPGTVRAERFEFLGIWAAAADRRFLKFAGIVVLISMVMAQLVVSTSIHGIEVVRINERQLGMLFSMNGLMVVFLQYPLGLWWSRWRITTALAAGALFYSAGYLVVGFARGFQDLMLGVGIVTMGEIVMSPGLNTLTANVAPAHLRGRYMGLLGFAHQLGSAFGPLVGGFGLQYLSPLWAPGHWVVIGAAAAAAAFAFVVLGRELRPIENGLLEAAAPIGLLKEAPARKPPPDEHLV